MRPRRGGKEPPLVGQYPADVDLRLARSTQEQSPDSHASPSTSGTETIAMLAGCLTGRTGIFAAARSRGAACCTAWPCPRPPRRPAEAPPVAMATPAGEMEPAGGPPALPRGRGMLSLWPAIDEAD
jgi:hypothetical protein